MILIKTSKTHWYQQMLTFMIMTLIRVPSVWAGLIWMELSQDGRGTGELGLTKLKKDLRTALATTELFSPASSLVLPSLVASVLTYKTSPGMFSWKRLRILNTWALAAVCQSPAMLGLITGNPSTIRQFSLLERELPSLIGIKLTMKQYRWTATNT